MLDANFCACPTILSGDWSSIKANWTIQESCDLLIENKFNRNLGYKIPKTGAT